MKGSDAGRRVIFTLNRDSVAGDERLEMPFILFIFSIVTVQCLKRTNWMQFKGSALYLLQFPYSTVSEGEQVPKCALPYIFQVSVTITATTSDRMAGVFCLSLVVPTEWSQWMLARNEAQLPSGCFNPPPTCRDTVSSVEVLNVRGKFSLNSVSHLTERFL